MKNASRSIALLLCLSGSFCSADWLTLPGQYTHDVATGQRVTQFAPNPVPTTAHQPIQSGGYTHIRSSLNYGQSADNYHRVESWGPPVRPYGEWRFPYRPYSTPYPNWGAPYAGLNLGLGFGQVLPGAIGGAGAFGGPRVIGQPQGNPNPGANNPNAGANTNPVQPAPVVPTPGFYLRPNPAAGANGLAPYPSGRGTPYPVAPYYDGYHPNYRQ